MQFNFQIPYAELTGQHVVLGLSGGVDSSVSAALLKAQGLKVTALFMKNWEEDDTESYCAAAEDRKDAQMVCDILGIELKTINFAAEYWDRVFEHFLAEYAAGRTPNPDILCNKEIKFKAFFDYAVRILKADFIATGHYALRSFDAPDGKVHLLRGLDGNKDQSYFLHAVDGRVLPQVLFPIGHLNKPQVREIAQEYGLPTARKKDSTGICFIGEKRFHQFLEHYRPAKPGNIVTPDGTTVGRHDGLMFATIGQRRGLNIGGRRDGSGEPWYVIDKNVEKNELIVTQGHESRYLYFKSVTLIKPTFILGLPELPLRCTCKVRYRAPDVPCTLMQDADGTLRAVFDTPVLAAAAGQSAVFYQEQECLGGAIIDRTFRAPCDE